VQNGYNSEATKEGSDRQQDAIETKSKRQHFQSKACIGAYIIGSFRMTGTGENVGESRLSYVGEADEAHFEIILDTAKPRRAHKLGVVAFTVLLLILRWHGSNGWFDQGREAGWKDEGCKRECTIRYLWYDTIILTWRNEVRKAPSVHLSVCLSGI
jgi:hypothetical protein